MILSISIWYLKKNIIIRVSIILLSKQSVDFVYIISNRIFRVSIRRRTKITVECTEAKAEGRHHQIFYNE
ncbi:hypothetical protein MASR1M45_27730 [Candidatus Kapaibacterium sp.]